MRVAISLTNSPLVAIIDEKDYSKISPYKWRLNRNKYSVFAVAKINDKIIQMHNLILKPRKGFEIAHMDKNGLHNWRDNLRYATHQQTHSYRKVSKNNISGFKGVYWYPLRSKYHVQIQVKGSKKHVGYFNNKEEAALAYNEAAKKYFGKFAKLNTIIS